MRTDGPKLTKAVLNSPENQSRLQKSTGDAVNRGGITKAGNGRARRILVEAAWSYRHPPRVSCVALADIAQRRLPRGPIQGRAGQAAIVIAGPEAPTNSFAYLPQISIGIGPTSINPQIAALDQPDRPNSWITTAEGTRPR